MKEKAPGVPHKLKSTYKVRIHYKVTVCMTASSVDLGADIEQGQSYDEAQHLLLLPLPNHQSSNLSQGGKMNPNTITPVELLHSIFPIISSLASAAKTRN
jgi:hypothetical protein